jgi:hypothetical protein
MEEQDIQLIFEILKEYRAESKAWREKIAAEREASRAETKAWQEEMAVMRKEMDANQAKVDAEWKAWRKRMDTSHKEIMAEIKPGRDMETMAYQEMEAHPEEEKPASVDMKPEAAEQQEVPIQDVTVMPVVEPEETTSVTRKETMACQEMENRLEDEPTSVDRKPEVAQQREVTVEDAIVKLVNGRKKRHRGKKQAAE